MAAERLDLAAAFVRTRKSDIVVVEGGFDRVQDVLDLLGLPYTMVQPDKVSRLRLEPEQILIVNCPGEVSALANLKIRRFVRAGRTLLTTD